MPQDKDLTIEYGQEDQESEAQGQEATPHTPSQAAGSGRRSVGGTGSQLSEANVSENLTWHKC